MPNSNKTTKNQSRVENGGEENEEEKRLKQEEMSSISKMRLKGSKQDILQWMKSLKPTVNNNSIISKFFFEQTNENKKRKTTRTTAEQSPTIKTSNRFETFGEDSMESETLADTSKINEVLKHDLAHTVPFEQ